MLGEWGDGYAKTHIIDFPEENWLYGRIPGKKFYYIAIFPRGKFYYGKIIVFFPGGGGGGEIY